MKTKLLILTLLLSLTLLFTSGVYAIKYNEDPDYANSYLNQMEFYFDDQFSYVDFGMDPDNHYAYSQFIHNTGSTEYVNFSWYNNDLYYSMTLTAYITGDTWDDNGSLVLTRPRTFEPFKYKLVIRHIAGNYSGTSDLKIGFHGTDYIYNLPQDVGETFSYILYDGVEDTDLRIYYEHVGTLSSNYEFAVMIIPIETPNTPMLRPIYYTHYDNNDGNLHDFGNTAARIDSLTSSVIATVWGDDENILGLVPMNDVALLGDSTISALKQYQNMDGFVFSDIKINYYNYYELLWSRQNSYAILSRTTPDANYQNKYYYGKADSTYLIYDRTLESPTISFNIWDDLVTDRDVISNDLYIIFTSSPALPNNSAGGGAGSAGTAENPIVPSPSISYTVNYYTFDEDGERVLHQTIQFTGSVVPEPDTLPIAPIQPAFFERWKVAQGSFKGVIFRYEDNFKIYLHSGNILSLEAVFKNADVDVPPDINPNIPPTLPTNIFTNIMIILGFNNPTAYILFYAIICLIGIFLTVKFKISYIFAVIWAILWMVLFTFINLLPIYVSIIVIGFSLLIFFGVKEKAQ